MVNPTDPVDPTEFPPLVEPPVEAPTNDPTIEATDGGKSPEQVLEYWVEKWDATYAELAELRERHARDMVVFNENIVIAERIAAERDQLRAELAAARAVPATPTEPDLTNACRFDIGPNRIEDALCKEHDRRWPCEMGDECEDCDSDPCICWSCNACEMPGKFDICCYDHQARMCQMCFDGNHAPVGAVPSEPGELR